MNHCLVKLSENRRLPVILMNTTNKTLSFKKGMPVSSIKLIGDATVSSVDKVAQFEKTTPTNDSHKSWLIKQSLIMLMYRLGINVKLSSY